VRTSLARSIILATALALAATGCSGPNAPTGDARGSRPKIDLSNSRPATFETHGSVNQVWLTGAAAGERLQLVDRGDRLVATAAADTSGSVIFRDVRRGRGYRVAGEGTVGTEVEVVVPSRPPDGAFYAAQRIAPGYGYLETRDGTLLAINVTLPGPPENGPYPTVIEYSGYSPANPESPQPSTLIARALGFATVGVNMRGTGCSGGAFQFFEPLQSTDGYDVVETIAAQPWVAHGKVGMVGISYPGISQLFTAATQPPHLAAIAPLSVIADTGRGTLRPGGIYNDGFAKSWAEERNHDAQAAPASGQAWAGRRIQNGDATCAENQVLRGQAPDVLQMIADNPYWNELAASLAPEEFVDDIRVPVFLAGAWQDEQTGPYFANMLDDFTGTRRAWFTVTNGGHTDALAPAVFDRWIQFLQIYVARQVPKRPAIAPIVAQVIGNTIWRTPVTLPPDRFAGATSLEQAQAIFEADPRVRILFENGAGGATGLPYSRFEGAFDRWPVPGTEARAWYFDEGSALVDRAPRTAAVDAYDYDTSRSQTTTLPGTDNDSTWLPLPPWNWAPPLAEHAVAYETQPLSDEIVMVGSGSVDLWIKANADDVDVQVTITEVRPDGSEVLVQSGWLRASQRKLAGGATVLRPLHTNREDDVRPLDAARWNEARVEIFPFAHAFRAGSRIRVIVDTPGGSRPRWKFDVLDETPGSDVQVEIARGGTHASRVVLPVVSGVDVTPELPACPSLRGQPCRPYASL
jgi:predicted acyl esterase